MSGKALLAPPDDAAASARDVLESKRTRARNREADEIVAGRTQVCHYYTGVADALSFALDVLEAEGVEP